jgi:hypothetical protein
MRMKKLIMIGSLFLSTAAMAQSPLNTLTAEEQKAGWKLLFDGKTTQGWHNYNKTTIGGSWVVKDGALCLDTTNKNGWQIKDGGDIVSDKSFENFHLKLEWNIAKDGNSGIMFNVQENPKYGYPWLTGPEMQVLDNDGHPDGKIIKHRAGDLYDLIKSNSEPVLPPGQWNSAEIISNKGSLTLILNAVTVVKTTIGDEQWKALIAGSKFKTMPDFGKFLSGKISLQDHGNWVGFRNIKLLEL